MYAKTLPSFKADIRLVSMCVKWFTCVRNPQPSKKIPLLTNNNYKSGHDAGWKSFNMALKNSFFFGFSG